MYLITNDNTSRTVRNYSYLFGSIKCIFKSQKSNGSISLFTIIDVDYVKNKHHYHLKIYDTKDTRTILLLVFIISSI